MGGDTAAPPTNHSCGALTPDSIQIKVINETCGPSMQVVASFLNTNTSSQTGVSVNSGQTTRFVRNATACCRWTSPHVLRLQSTRIHCLSLLRQFTFCSTKEPSTKPECLSVHVQWCTSIAPGWRSPCRRRGWSTKRPKKVRTNNIYARFLAQCLFY